MLEVVKLAKYKVGAVVEGIVTGIESYGVFVSLDEFYSGLIHISEISHDFVRDINDFVSLGETIKAKIVSVDDENFQVKLSIKDFDYKKVRNRKMKIEEVGSGFLILKDHLDDWILTKKMEIKGEIEKK